MTINAVGLINTYSRSAWIGAGLGLLLLGGHLPLKFLMHVRLLAKASPAATESLAKPTEVTMIASLTPKHQMLRIAVTSAFLFMGVLLFYKTHHVDVIFQRSRSLADKNDASLTNRALTWLDAIPMVFRRECGWGWERWDYSFEREFMRSRQTHGGSIILNDHLSIGIIFGWPIVLLWCVAVAAWFSKHLREQSQCRIVALVACLLPVSIANNVIFDASLGTIWWGLFIGGINGKS
ncbi:MAG: hypothetical protein ACREH8_20490 [Opitutaceae bacterium]